MSPSEVRPAEVRPAEVRLTEVRSAEVRGVEVCSAEVRPAEVRLAEVRPTEVRYFMILLSPLVPCGYSLTEDLQLFLVGHRLSVILPLWQDRLSLKS